MPFSVREGINVFLAGFVPTENLRFREEALSFKVATNSEDEISKPTAHYKYPAMVKTLTGNESGSSTFKLNVAAGEFSNSQIVVMLGENGTGKTTFIRMLAGLLSPDTEPGKKTPDLKGFSVSYKPQKISPSFEGTVRQLLFSKIKEAYVHPQFNSDVLKPLNLDGIIDNEVKTLSGGELQRVALALCLGKPADVYLIDEPSAYLDSEQRIIASKIIKRFILHAKKTAFIVEHDFIMATYLADRVIVYEGSPGVDCKANAPQGLLTGMNTFLKVSSRRRRLLHLRAWWRARQRVGAVSLLVAHSRARATHCSLPPFSSPPPPAATRHHLPPRPHQLPPPHQQVQLSQGPGAEEGGHLLLHRAVEKREPRRREGGGRRGGG